jgi:ABC-type multidrug transport system permease subunit
MSVSPNLFTPLTRAGLLAGKDLLVQFQSPVLLVFLVAMPLGMILITGLAFKGFEPRTIDATVAVVVPDNPARAKELAKNLQQKPEMALFDTSSTEPHQGAGIRLSFLPRENLTEAEAREEVRTGRLGGVLLFPREPGAGPVRLLVGPEATFERFAVESTLDRVFGETEKQRRPEVPGVQSPRWEVVPVESQGSQVSGFNSFAQAVAGNGVMFILLNCIMSGALGLIRERRQHTLDRLMIAPLSRGTILSGKILGVYLLGVLQAIVIFGFGLVVRVPLGNLLGVCLVTLVFILVGCSLGLMISALARREENVQLLGGPIGLVMAALGGGMFPVEMAPAWMQKLALAFPTGWAMQAYHKLMWEGASVAAVLPNLLVLAGFAGVFFLIGARSLQWE